MKRDTIEWAAILKSCGVKAAQLEAWAPIFSSVINEKSFSLGEKELDIFLGQILHESAMLTRMEENLNYSAKRIIEMGKASPVGSRWRSLVPKANALAHNPKAFAKAVYGGRLGNVGPDDGWNYRGSGPIQVTGYDNFKALAKLTKLPLLAQPELLRAPTAAALQVCIAWWEGNVPDSVMSVPKKVRKEVNGGTFGLDDTVRIAGLASAALMA